MTQPQYHRIPDQEQEDYMVPDVWAQFAAAALGAMIPTLVGSNTMTEGGPRAALSVQAAAEAADRLTAEFAKRFCGSDSKPGLPPARAKTRADR